MTHSTLEARMAWQLRLLEGQVQAPEREYRFAPRRRWRFDFAWPAARVALEVEGGVWSNGRHSRGNGFGADCAKYNEATLLGWKVLRVTGEHVTDGQALAWVRRALATEDGEELT